MSAWRRFRAHRRAWPSFVVLTGLFAASWMAPALVNDRALAVSRDGHLRFPALEGHIEARELGQAEIGEARYRALKRQYAGGGRGDWVLLAPYPYGPDESLLDELPGAPPHAPDGEHWMGTDDRGRDVLARLVYGFRLSVSFGLATLVGAYGGGVLVGAALGYAGRRVDLVGQRLVEIWSGLPFLYTAIIVSSLVRPSVPALVLLLAAFGWTGISVFVRGEVYRERGRDYVLAAVAHGESPAAVLLRHVLPNALVATVSLAPFAFVAFVTDLVQLDYLGFGVPAPTASWGELVGQGLGNLREWHLVAFPLGAMFLTLLLVVFVGEGVRDAFDPRPRA